MPIQYLPITWQDYHCYCQKLAAAILTHEKHLDEIVAIGRGGLSIGLILSDMLKLPISSIAIQSYTDIKKQGQLTITQTLGKEICGKQVLLVDDNADSGKTFLRAISYLKEFKPKRIVTAAIFYKPWSTYTPDYYAKRTTRWILFPHEVTEWIYTFTNKMTEDGKSKAEIQTFLENLGYTDDQIKFVRRHYLSK